MEGAEAGCHPCHPCPQLFPLCQQCLLLLRHRHLHRPLLGAARRITIVVRVAHHSVAAAGSLALVGADPLVPTGPSEHLGHLAPKACSATDDHTGTSAAGDIPVALAAVVHGVSPRTLHRVPGQKTTSRMSTTATRRAWLPHRQAPHHQPSIAPQITSRRRFTAR